MGATPVAVRKRGINIWRPPGECRAPAACQNTVFRATPFLVSGVTLVFAARSRQTDYCQNRLSAPETAGVSLVMLSAFFGRLIEKIWSRDKLCTFENEGQIMYPP